MRMTKSPNLNIPTLKANLTRQIRRERARDLVGAVAGICCPRICRRTPVSEDNDLSVGVLESSDLVVQPLQVSLVCGLVVGHGPLFGREEVVEAHLDSHFFVFGDAGEETAAQDGDVGVWEAEAGTVQ